MSTNTMSTNLTGLNLSTVDHQILNDEHILSTAEYKTDDTKLILLTLVKNLNYTLINKEKLLELSKQNTILSNQNQLLWHEMKQLQQLQQLQQIQNKNILNKLQEQQTIKENNNNNNTTILEELSAEFSSVRGDVHEMASTIVNSDEYVEKKIKYQLPKMFQCLERKMTNNIIRHTNYMAHTIYNNINNTANTSQQTQPPPNKPSDQPLNIANTRNDNKKPSQTNNTTAAPIHSQLYPTTVPTTHSQMNTKLTSTSIHPCEVEPKQMHQIPPLPSQSHPNIANINTSPKQSYPNNNNNTSNINPIDPCGAKSKQIQPNAFSLPQKVIDKKDTFNIGTKSQSHTITVNTKNKSPPTASGDKQLQQAQPKPSSIPQKPITNVDLNIKNVNLLAISRKNNNINNNNNNKNSTSTELSTALLIPPKPHTQLNENNFKIDNIKSPCSDSVNSSPIYPLREKRKSLSNFNPNKRGQSKSINQPQTKSKNPLDSSIFLEISTDKNININSPSVSVNIPNNINIKSFNLSNKPSSIKPLREKRNYSNKPQINRNTSKTKQKKKKIKNNNNNKQKNKIKKQQKIKKRTTINKKNKNNLNNNTKHLIGFKIDKKEDKYDLNKFKNEEIDNFIINHEFTQDKFDDWLDYNKNIGKLSVKEYYEMLNGKISDKLIKQWFDAYRTIRSIN